MPVTRVLVLSPELRVGGLAEHVRCLALGAESEGSQITITVPGVRDSFVFPENARIVEVDYTTRTGIAGVQSLVRGADAVLGINSPETALLWPLLADARMAALGVHGSPLTNGTWLGQRLHALVSAACKSLAGLPILIPAEADRAEIAAEFGVYARSASRRCPMRSSPHPRT